jgi:hypothetical protein
MSGGNEGHVRHKMTPPKKKPIAYHTPPKAGIILLLI